MIQNVNGFYRTTFDFDTVPGTELQKCQLSWANGRIPVTQSRSSWKSQQKSYQQYIGGGTVNGRTPAPADR